MHQLNASIEAVVCSGAFVPMSKCARMLVLFLGIFLVINSQTNFISSQDFFDLDDKNNQKMNTSSRSTPVITDFSILSPQLGDGISPSTRAWFSVDETDSLSFEWSATDDNIDFASLSNSPGDTPSPDVSPFNYEWEITGGLDEGIFNPILTVQDLDSNVATSTLYIGIDRTGPTVGSPSLSYDDNGVSKSISSDDWISTNEINVSNLNVGVTDNGGVGVDSYEYQILSLIHI